MQKTHLKTDVLQNILILVLVVLCGCATSAGSRVPGKLYAATDPDKVEVFYENPARPYEVVGFVSIERAVAGSDTVIERKYRTVASTMGADAVIVEILPKTSFWGPVVQGKGKAIRWK